MFKAFVASQFFKSPNIAWLYTAKAAHYVRRDGLVQMQLLCDCQFLRGCNMFLSVKTMELFYVSTISQ